MAKTTLRSSLLLLMSLIALTSYSVSCAKKPSADDLAGIIDGGGRYLYVASGACYSGGNTTFSNTTSSNLVYRINLSTGNRDAIVADYLASPSNTGDSPVGLANIDTDNLYVLVENTTTTSLRRIEKVQKRNLGSRSVFSNNTTALAAQVRNLLKLNNGDLLATRTSAVEYINTSNVRIGAPYINPSAAPCASSNTLITKSISIGAYGRFLFLHAGAAQSRFGIMAPNGGTACMTSGVQAAPAATAFPVAAVFDAANSKIIVAYAGNAATADLNSIYVYPYSETVSTVSIGTGVKIYDASSYPATYPYLLYGISEMTYDADNSTLYVATAINTATTVANYAIEKLTYNPSQIGVDNTKVLTRVGSTPFYPYGNDTKCISQMMISN